MGIYMTMTAGTKKDHTGLNRTIRDHTIPHKTIQDPLARPRGAFAPKKGFGKIKKLRSHWLLLLYDTKCFTKLPSKDV